MEVPKTKENTLSRGPNNMHAYGVIMNDVKNFYNDVIMTAYDEIFAGAPTQTVLLGFRNLHAKNRAFSSMCETSLHYN